MKQVASAGQTTILSQQPGRPVYVLNVWDGPDQNTV
jgi:hypothetical protein